MLESMISNGSTVVMSTLHSLHLPETLLPDHELEVKPCAFAELSEEEDGGKGLEADWGAGAMKHELTCFSCANGSLCSQDLSDSKIQA